MESPPPGRCTVRQSERAPVDRKRLAPAALLFGLVLSACAGSPPARSPVVLPPHPAPVATVACNDISALATLSSESATGAYTASELVPKLQDSRDRLFADAKSLGSAATGKETFLDKNAPTGDIVYQLGLRAGGLAQALAASTGGDGLFRKGIAAFSTLATARLHC